MNIAARREDRVGGERSGARMGRGCGYGRGADSKAGGTERGGGGVCVKRMDGR